jgi:hypothetical protein
MHSLIDGRTCTGSPIAERRGIRMSTGCANTLRSLRQHRFGAADADEDGVIVDIDGTPTEIVQRALLALDLTPPTASP